MKYFNVIGAVDNIYYVVKVYQLHKFTTVRVGYTYKFANCIDKGDCLLVVSTSSIGFSKMVDVSDSLVLPELPEEEPATGSKRTLAMALQSPSKSTVQAKIVKVSLVKFTCNETLPVRCLGVKDASGLAKIALFDNLAEQTYTANTTVEVSGVYRKVYNTKSQLTMTRQTTCQFISDDAVTVTVNEKDVELFKQDGDFAVPAKEEMLDYTIDALYEVASYNACSTQACRKKKLVEGVCPTCEGSDSVWTYRAKV